MRFRPLPLLTVLAAPALALLVALGVWQLDRMDWKQAEIERWRARQGEAPVSLDQAYCGRPDPFSRRVERPDPASGSIVMVYGRNPDGAPGWRVFQNARVGDCAGDLRVLTEAGFLPHGETRMTEFHEGPMVLERPTEPGAFTPERDPETLRFYGFDAAAMEAVLQLEPGTLWEEGWLVTDHGALPPRLAQTPPARHFGYAITWFGLAGALVAVYLALHMSRGRLVFTRRKE
ncbi:hypothetical protein DDZ18_08330 [Marinicauda salina]|uniref:SURF1-like protein n=1 Tax=Marinicauda salina TaxID=2135793 RepID=A0A2U2BUE6_9PROT|nr:SURF1 family protein [Marinicauda salina]PWE17655.1 hypothetical protein DDZ18_08330 [Marinicauda salina]